MFKKKKDTITSIESVSTAKDHSVPNRMLRFYPIFFIRDKPSATFPLISTSTYAQLLFQKSICWISPGPTSATVLPNGSILFITLYPALFTFTDTLSLVSIVKSPFFLPFFPTRIVFVYSFTPFFSVSPKRSRYSPR